jgi:hypothetical protein
MEVGELSESRHSSLPSLPKLTIPRIRSHDEYVSEPQRSVPMSAGGSNADAGSAPYHPPSYQGYHHPSRAQSLSFGSLHYDRTPFSPSGYSSQYPEYVRVGELGAMGMSGDNKQRKRRGNLPKETTDKLRAWFVAHLSHPYPTEDEKQDLMRQTGLQMSKSMDINAS